MDKKSDDLLTIANEIRENTKLREAIKKTTIDQNDCNFFVVFVFKSQKERNDMLESKGLPINKYQDGKELERME